ncbi:protein NETWORKED 3C [Manihot esculenta]|uniref:NAB domain-containing protein n=1 Tax=Manihot esculenta TaxID=3983 RepID=A0A2C9WMT1_MANES|nr:protein NETWORKED 3C [Manihot esculenta]OAY61755.1 hypothetical protein MANES_01G213900v8 [Manihot esculenta]
MMNKDTSHWWWFESHQNSKRSPWLQSTLGELERKTKAMLKLIEEDADSFAERAEMYYEKRPQLISMVEDFYRTHRSLAEKYDQLKSDSGNRLITTLGSPFSIKYQQQKLMGGMDETYGGHSETYDPEDSAESEVEDPEQEVEIVCEEEMGEVEDPEEKLETSEIEVSGAVFNDEVMRMQEELERLVEEKRIWREQLLQKDEEKREVIRQLSLAIEVLKLENVQLRKHVARGSTKKTSLFELKKLKEVFSWKLFNGFSESRGRGSVVAT